jgi:hypothetical protein
MAHFAELDSNNIVLRVVVACDQDIANNGGEQSIEAAEYFKKICPLSSNGVRWVQTSYNSNFRKEFAGVNKKYDDQHDLFYAATCANPSWTLDSNFNWQPPVARPSIVKSPISEDYLIISWNEDKLKWVSFAYDNDVNRVNFEWNPNTLVWDKV